jgi:hypothetical protein
MGGISSMHEKDEKCTWNKKEELLGKSRRRPEENIKLDIRQTICKVVN